MERIFVYGRLREGMYNYKRFLEGNSTFLGYGYVKGALYALMDVPYPALLEGNDTIIGEIYEVDEDVAAAIDELEGYIPDDQMNHYHKVTLNITLENQETLALPVYLYNQNNECNPQLGERITSGDYLAYMADKQK